MMQFLRFDEGMDDSLSIYNRMYRDYGKIIEDHLSDLTPAESKVLHGYQRYGYFHINKSLRKRLLFRPFVGRSIEILRQLILRKTIPDNLIVYRGRVAKKFRGMSKNTIQDPAFLSTTLNKYVALGFCHKFGDEFNRELLEIQIPKGTNGLIVGSGECEVIFPPKTAFEIVKTVPSSITQFDHYSRRMSVTKIELRLKNV